MIRGAMFLFDERGQKTAVMIDLRQGGRLWEDILDVAMARSRGREPSHTWASVRSRVEKSGRLKKGRCRYVFGSMMTLPDVQCVAIADVQAFSPVAPL